MVMKAIPTIDLRAGVTVSALFAVSAALWLSPVMTEQASASVVIAATNATASSTFTSSTGADYSILNTIDQSGLSLSYTSGQTNFEDYIAGNPTHTSTANGNEWFSRNYSTSSNTVKKNKKKNKRNKALSFASSSNGSGVFSPASSTKKKVKRSKKSNSLTSAAAKKKPKDVISVSGLTVTYNFAEPTSIGGLALWNEEFAGIASAELRYSLDGSTYQLLTLINPHRNAYAPPNTVVPYLPQVFSFDFTTMLYLQMKVLTCYLPATKDTSYRGCSVGEVAFSADLTPVPVPAALPLLGTGLGALAWARRRQRKQRVIAA